MARGEGRNVNFCLSDAILTGQSLRHVTELEGQRAALLAFSGASLHLKAQEGWIGWQPNPFRDDGIAIPGIDLRFDRAGFEPVAGTCVAVCLTWLQAVEPGALQIVLMNWQEMCCRDRTGEQESE